MVFCVSALISLNEIITNEHPINFTYFFALAMLATVTSMPIVLIIMTFLRYINLKNTNSKDFKRWGGGHISRLKMQQNLTNDDSDELHAIQIFRLSKT